MFSLSAVREALDNGRDMHPDGIPVLAARVSQEGNEDSYYNTNLWKRTLLDLRGVFLVDKKIICVIFRFINTYYIVYK